MNTSFSSKQSLLIVIGLVLVIAAVLGIFVYPQALQQQKADEEARKNTEMIKLKTEKLSKYNDCLIQLLDKVDQVKAQNPQMTLQKQKELQTMSEKGQLECEQKFPKE